MANNYSATTVTPYIPRELITEKMWALLDAVGGMETDGQKDVYFYSEDGIGYGELDGEEVSEEDIVGEFQTIIKNSNGKLPWVAFETSYTCDKMRQGEFGGSAIFITADDVQYVGTNTWLTERISEVETGNTHD